MPRPKTKGGILKPQLNKFGYSKITLLKNCKQYLVSIHRLVAQTFIDNPNNFPEVNHKDGDKTNNNVSNLEWCTQQHNIKESFKNGLQKIPKGKNNKLSKKVLQNDLQNNFIKLWDCTMDIQRELGFKNHAISKCCNGNLKTAYGFIWRYM